MVFTSLSKCNKHNKFHIGFQEYILIYLNEIIEFMLVKPVTLLVPTIYNPIALSTEICKLPNKIECINTMSLIDSCCKSKERLIKLNLITKPKRIITSRVLIVDKRQKLIPSPSKKSALAILFYDYYIEVKYIDKYGNIQLAKTKLSDNQRVILNSDMGKLNVRITIDIHPFRQEKSRKNIPLVLS